MKTMATPSTTKPTIARIQSGEIAPRPFSFPVGSAI